MRALRLAGMLLLCGAGAGQAQVQRREVIRVDTLRRAGDTLRGRADSAAADTTRGRTVVPRNPSRTFPAPDSILQALLERRGFRVTRYAADSVQLLADDKEIRLAGRGLINRDGSTLEADTVRYVERNCQLLASGSPRLFDPSGNLMGEGMRYDACNKAGIVRNATTDLQHGGGTWLLHGDIAVDNAEDRTYAAGAEITSCTLEEAHYHFATREVKWVNKRLMVARPAVLYVADVPVLWLPFVFQDTRRGRRSGILAPQFGINDLVRFNPGYSRHITNVGYYFAISDYADAQTSLDWYAGRSLTLNGRLRYRWLDRFMAGGIAYQELRESGGNSSRRMSWSHQQQFSLTSQLSANLDYATSSRVISRNAVDPILAVGTIDSRLNYQRRSGWGTLNLGGSRTQSLDKPQVSLTFPTLAFTPNPVALSRSVTISPSFSFTNSLLQNAAPGAVLFRGATPDTQLTDSRTSNLSLSAPLRIGSWTLSNSFAVNDTWSSARSTQTVYPDPADSTQRTIRTYGETFQTGVDWSIGFGLPVLFQGSWNLQPSTQLVNTTSGPYALRNQFTDGSYLIQGKRFQFSAGVSPTLFGLFPGIGPVQRIRHAVSPSLSWAYSPPATIDSAFATAANQGRTPATLRVPARHTLSLGLSQIFEAKLRTPRQPGDTARADSGATDVTADAGPPSEGRKIKLLSIQSDPISYDFEQAKLPDRTGWTTATWGNTLSSDLIRGFSLRLAHDLWDGPVGVRGSKLRPFLTSVQMGFSVGAGTLGLFRRALGLGVGGPARADTATSDSLTGRNPTDVGRSYTNAFQRGPLATQFSTMDRLGGSRGGGFSATLNFSLQRARPVTTTGGTGTGTAVPAATGATNSMMNGAVRFSPTQHWSVSWQTSYNFTQGTFADHVVRLDRDMHDWRATFTFVRSPNGNFLFNFYIELIAEPDLKFAYDQRNVR